MHKHTKSYWIIKLILIRHRSLRRYVMCRSFFVTTYIISVFFAKHDWAKQLPRYSKPTPWSTVEVTVSGINRGRWKPAHTLERGCREEEGEEADPHKRDRQPNEGYVTVVEEGVWMRWRENVWKKIKERETKDVVWVFHALISCGIIINQRGFPKESVCVCVCVRHEVMTYVQMS